MKYYSELTKKPYDTVEDLKKAEAEVLASKEKEDAKKAERANEAKKVQDAMNEAKKAYEAAYAARKEANNKLNEFCKKYGSYHATYRGLPDIIDIIEYLF